MSEEHPESQIIALAKIIRHQGWRNPIVVSKRSNFVIKRAWMFARSAGFLAEVSARVLHRTGICSGTALPRRSHSESWVRILITIYTKKAPPARGDALLCRVVNVLRNDFGAF